MESEALYVSKYCPKGASPYAIKRRNDNEAIQCSLVRIESPASKDGKQTALNTESQRNAAGVPAISPS